MNTTLPPQGCHRCSTPVSETYDPREPGVQAAVTVDTGMAYVVMCPDCAGVDPAEAVRDLDPEYVAPPVDMDACVRCNGTGGIQVSWSYDTGAEYDVCPDCEFHPGRRALGGAA